MRRCCSMCTRNACREVGQTLHDISRKSSCITTWMSRLYQNRPQLASPPGPFQKKTVIGRASRALVLTPCLLRWPAAAPKGSFQHPRGCTSELGSSPWALGALGPFFPQLPDPSCSAKLEACSSRLATYSRYAAYLDSPGKAQQDRTVRGQAWILAARVFRLAARTPSHLGQRWA